MKKYVKGILNGLFLLLLMGLTLYFLLRDQELTAVMAAMKQSSFEYILAGILLVIVYVCSESVIIHHMMGTLGYRAPLKRCIRYSFIGFFFCCVTPSATGGQPAQVYYMRRDGLDISVSSLVLMVITVAYKGVLLLLAGLAFFTEGAFIREHLGNVRYILFYGIIINGLFMACLLVVIFRPSLVRWCSAGIVHRLARWGVVKDEQGRMEKIYGSLDQYHEASLYLRKHGMLFVQVLLITLVQRLSLFAVTWVIYCSFGLTGTGLWRILCLQAILSLSVDMLPLPGGMGASEASFMVMFRQIFGEKLILPGMLLSRGISYYILVLLSGAVTCAAHVIGSRGEKVR